MYVSICMYVCMKIRFSVCLCIPKTYVFMYVFVDVYVYIFMCVCLYLSMYVCMYVYLRHLLYVNMIWYDMIWYGMVCSNLNHYCPLSCDCSVRLWHRQRAVLQCGTAAVAGEGPQCVVAQYEFQCQGRAGEYMTL